MKAFKKMAAVIAAATMAVSAMAVSSFAEGEAYKLYVKAEDASVGDTVSVSVTLDSNEEMPVGGISFKVYYDTDALELQWREEQEEVDDGVFETVTKPDVTIGSAISKWTTGDDEYGCAVNEEKGFIGLAYTTTGKSTIKKTDVEIVTISFKVLKVNSTVRLEDVNLAGEDDSDVTPKTDITDEAVVKCSHKNTDTKTEIADCEKGGKAVTTCKDCGETVKTEDIAPTEHKVDKWTETKKATCTEKGEEEGVCTVCGKTVTRETEMVDHTFGEWKETTAPTCTQKGEETRECTVCGITETRAVEALGHNFGEWSVVKEATCTEKGTEERVCSRCDEKETRETDMIDHTVEWKVTKEATCTEAGEKTGTCTVCGNEVTEEIPALGHDWGEWKTVKEATETEKGSEERECSVCGEKETREIPAKGENETPNTSAGDNVTTAPETSVAGDTNNSDGSDKNSPDTGVAGVTAVAGIAAIAAAAVVIAKKRK